MSISEKKMQIVIDNYFKSECDVNTSIRQAFEKGFRIGVKKGQSTHPERKRGEWDDIGGVIRYGCPFCHYAQERKSNFCPHCGAELR